MQLLNDTPFEAERLVDLDREGFETLIVAVKGTYGLPGPTERSVELVEQVPLHLADEYYGEPASSSIKYEADIGMPKLGTDVVLCGYAYPKKLGDTSVDVAIRLGNLQKVARVFGDRVWESSMGVSQISRPKPFKRIPLVYERSFGGADTSHKSARFHDYERRNPVGVGYKITGSAQGVEGTPLPNIENPAQLISRPGDKPPPHGFGFVSKDWEPRVSYIGTYDAAWTKHRMPLLPEDFDDRYHTSASQGLAVDGFLQGGEPVEVRNASETGYVAFHLPVVPLAGSLLVGKDMESFEMKINTVLIDTFSNTLKITWRGSARIHKRVEDVRWVRCEVKT